MAEKRKDSKNRILKDGESERREVDKDGKVRWRYSYRYLDKWSGKRKTVYSFDLAELREKQAKIQKDMNDNIRTDASKVTLNQAFDSYMEDVILNTASRNVYEGIWRLYIRDKLGNGRVCEIGDKAIKKLYADMLKRELSGSYVAKLHTLLSSVFKAAIKAKIIRENPAEGAMGNIDTSSKEKDIMTKEQQAALLEYVRNSDLSQVHYPIIQFALETGMRIGEISGLTWDKIDMKERKIYVTRQAAYVDTGNGYEHIMSKPKTKKGVRTIPMSVKAYEALKKQMEHRLGLGEKRAVEVDGAKDFVFPTRNGRPRTSQGFNQILAGIVDRYNTAETQKAIDESREPLLLPHISSHCLRHTCGTRWHESGLSPKTIQELLGHEKISTTFDIYVHSDDEHKTQEIAMFDAKRNDAAIAV